MNQPLLFVDGVAAVLACIAAPLFVLTAAGTVRHYADPRRQLYLAVIRLRGGTPPRPLRRVALWGVLLVLSVAWLVAAWRTA